MALENAALLEVLEVVQAAGVEDRVRTATQTIYQAIIDAELTHVIGAGAWERSAEWTGQRNGTRPRTLTNDGRGSGAADPEAAGRVVLLVVAPAAPGGWTRRCSRW